MSNLTHKPEEKLLAMVDNVVIRRDKHKTARISGNVEMELREYGRFDKSVNDLAKVAKKISKAGQP